MDADSKADKRQERREARALRADKRERMRAALAEARDTALNVRGGPTSHDAVM